MAKATTIKEALAKWEEKTGQKASEAKEVKLYGQIPPVERMDESLSMLVNCEKLSLSTNCIERIANLNSLKNLRILSLGRNNIKNLNGLKVLGLWFFTTNIGNHVNTWFMSDAFYRMSLFKAVPTFRDAISLKREMYSQCVMEAVADTLEELWISYNFIEKLRGIRVMKKLKVLYMSNNLVKDWGNPLQEKYASDQKNSWIEEASKRVPKLKKLDGILVIKQEDEEEGGN
ncbi:dynein axonemal light chain 1 isoform X2 [Dromaius novaehollandiae]|uniref:dynein axonemal light chain 1 isoform X2 n=1 Tax=Dromaius novaehollandiae TaxID=8790 RepID=UPI00311DD741